MHLYSYYAREVHRDWLARYEREAELRRMLPKRERRGPLARRRLRLESSQTAATRPATMPVGGACR